MGRRSDGGVGRWDGKGTLKRFKQILRNYRSLHLGDKSELFLSVHWKPGDEGNWKITLGINYSTLSEKQILKPIYTYMFRPYECMHLLHYVGPLPCYEGNCKNDFSNYFLFHKFKSRF